MNARVRIGVVGAGENTRAKHIPLLQQIPGVEIVVVANRTRESGERVAREFGIARVAADWREVVAAADIDAVVIGTWPYLHAEISIAALRAGKHVLTEARMARDLAEARAMLAEARRHPRLVAQIVPAPFSIPFDGTVREWLDRGRLGVVREVHAAFTHGGFASAAAPFSWRQDSELSGKNTLFLGIFYEMVLRWLRREPESVVADAAVFTRERRDERGAPREVRIPESLTVLGRYADGARLVMHFSGVETSAPRNEIRINGSEAGLRADFATGTLWFAARGQAEQRVEIAPEKCADWRVEADFIDSIREGRPVRLTDFETGVRYMAFTEAVWESWTRGG
ncbi:MAG: gfo/Idh/MocA family oxidoreductase, partial [Opitutus sp.]|nr:gfo/Idh/MocA family oxidoreductase [Opitutus sp.]